MLRRQTRLRREYIYRKSIEQQQRQILDRKTRLKQALESNTRIPSDLRDDALNLQKHLAWDDEGGEGVVCQLDDEYRFAGVEDPKVMVTTSRDPSSKLKQFAKEMKIVIPNSQRINRGNYEIKQLIDACRANDVTDVIMLHEHRGVPDQLILSHLPFGPTAYFTLLNTVSRHDVPDKLKTISEAYPHLIFHNFSSPLGKRVANILKHLFPVPKENSKRVLTFANTDDYISFRHHIYTMVDREVDLTEVGPRFEMKLYKIIQGTIDQADSADLEWTERPYMNTARKRKHLTVNE